MHTLAHMRRNRWRVWGALALLGSACGDDGGGGGATEGSTGMAEVTGDGPGPASTGSITGEPGSSGGTSASATSGSTGVADDSSDGGDSSGSGTDTGGSRACGEHGSYDVAFNTFFGGANDWEHTRGIAVGEDGSIVVVGGTASDDFPTTPGAYDVTYNGGGGQTGQGGDVDVFVAKFNPDGTLAWSTLFGSPNYDRAYTVRIDGEGNVIFGGRAGPGLPTTPGSLQPTYQGFDPGFYGAQNAFLAKLSADGSQLMWATYLGVGALVRTFDVDDAGDIYAVLSIEGGSSNNWPAWMNTAFDNAYQPTPASAMDVGVVKVAGDGASVPWATWIGGSGDDRPTSTLRVDDQGRAHLLVPTTSTDLETTPGAWQTTAVGNQDLYLARLSADGSALEVGTYIGGSALDEVETHGLAVSDDAIYVGFYTASTDIETTPGAFQSAYAGGGLDMFVARLDDAGGLVASTYVGGSGDDGSDGFDVTPGGDVVFVGETNSPDFPTSADAFQPSLGGLFDGTIVRLSPDLSTLVYGTYLGGPNRENLRTSAIDGDCGVVVAGATDGPGMPTVNAMQPNFAGGSGDFGNGDNIVARLVSMP